MLFITQKVDKEDDVLGVYYRWIEELGKRVDKLSVICLYRGWVDLPLNISVFSLGKENGVSKLSYILNFLKYAWRLRRDYDSVFVHMNPEYVILGGWLWRLMGKKIVFWYAHYLANLRLRIAQFLADKVVTSTRLAYPLDTMKLEVLQQGIDTSWFKPANSLPGRQAGKPPAFALASPRLRKASKASAGRQNPKKNFKILSLGRIAPVKNYETLIETAKILKDKGVDFLVTIIGEAPSLEKDKNYEQLLIAERG